MKHSLWFFLVVGLLWTTVWGQPEQNREADSSSAKPTVQKAHADKITWHKYNEGLKLAQQSGKKLVIEFTAVWCGWCRKMQATTFKDSTVIDLVDKYYIAVTLDGESRDTLNVDGWITTGRELAGEYSVRNFPTIWFLTSTGERIAPLIGYRDAVGFANVLDYLKDDTYKSTKFQDFLAKKNGQSTDNQNK